MRLARADADDHLVEEDAAVDLTHVDTMADPVSHGVDGGRYVERNIEVLGQGIDGAERQDGKVSIGADKRRCKGRDGAVAAGGDDRSGAAPQRVGDAVREGPVAVVVDGHGKAA
jgi:hypothetical protein